MFSIFSILIYNFIVFYKKRNETKRIGWVKKMPIIQIIFLFFLAPVFIVQEGVD